MFDIIYSALLALLVISWNLNVPVKLFPYAKRDRDYPLVVVISIVLVFSTTFVVFLMWDVASQMNVV